MNSILSLSSSFAIGMTSYALANLSVQGLSNTLGLVTLRHGTNPISWLSIQILGGRTHFGGSAIGGEYSGSKYASQNLNRFYMAPDSDYWGSDDYFRVIDKDKAFVETSHFGETEKIDLLAERPTVDKFLGEWPLFPHWLRNKIFMRLLPKTYACKSNINVIQGVIGDVGYSLVKAIATAILAVPTGFINPTIKFRVSEETLKNLDPDLSYPPGVACSSTENISALNIGLRGVIWNSLTPKTFSRMTNNLTRVICGIAEVVFCALTALYIQNSFPAFVTLHKTAILGGVFFAAFS